MIDIIMPVTIAVVLAHIIVIVGGFTIAYIWNKYKDKIPWTKISSGSS